LRPKNWTIFELEFPTATFLAGKGVDAMKASKFTDAQKAFIVKQGNEGTTVAEICRKSGDVFQLEEKV